MLFSPNSKTSTSKTIAVSATWLERAISCYPAVLQMQLKARGECVTEHLSPHFSVKTTLFRDPAGDEDNRLGTFSYREKAELELFKIPPW